MQARRLLGSILAYTLYAFVVFGVMLYTTFPYQVLQERLREPLRQRGLRLTMARLRPAFPPGLSTRDVRLHLEASENNTPVLQMQTVHVRPDWRDLLTGKFQARFNATLYNGRVKGTLRYAAGEQRWILETQMENLDIAQYPLVRGQKTALVAGKLRGTATVVWHNTGDLGDSVVNGQLEPLMLVGKHELLLLQQDIICDKSKFELKLVTGQPNPVSFDCQGKDLTIDTRGTISWQSPLLASEVNLRWQMHSEAAYRQELSLLSGFISRPLDRRGDLIFRMQGPLRRLRYGA